MHKKIILAATVALFAGCGRAGVPEGTEAPIEENYHWASGVQGPIEEESGVEDAEADLDLEEMSIAPLAAAADFSVGSQLFKLDYGQAQKWNGCDTSARVVGGYSSDSKCGSGYFLPAFARHLNSYFFSCVDKAAVRAKIARPSRIFLRHLGTYVSRNGRGSSSLSMHAYARAIDIAQFNLYDSQGRVTSMSNAMRDYKGATAVFYDSFRQCWKDTLPKSCVPGKAEYKGSIGHPKSALGGNSLHTGHIHLSFPMCAG